MTPDDLLANLTYHSTLEQADDRAQGLLSLARQRRRLFSDNQNASRHDISHVI